MAYTVWGAFDAFRTDTVDLNKDDTKTARASRDFLFGQLKGLNSGVSGFPPMTGEYIHFGSFARRTKIRPLDDIDMMILLKGAKTTATQVSSDIYKYWLKIDDTTAPLNAFRDEYGYVNSTKILNKIKSSLPLISQYNKADIKKTMQAVTLDLKSYSWIFDIVPAVAISDYSGSGTAYYLIPDGTGEWIRTDPRKDSSYLSRVSAKHNSNLLPVMRLLKYWNNRTYNKSRLRPYYFETVVLKTFEFASAITSYPTGIKYFFDYGATYLNSSCPDPKGLGPNLDAGVTWETKLKITNAMREAATNAGYALMYEGQGNQEMAIYWWKQVFGPGFPSYG